MEGFVCTALPVDEAGIIGAWTQKLQVGDDSVRLVMTFIADGRLQLDETRGAVRRIGNGRFALSGRRLRLSWSDDHGQAYERETDVARLGCSGGRTLLVLGVRVGHDGATWTGDEALRGNGFALRCSEELSFSSAVAELDPDAGCQEHWRAEIAAGADSPAPLHIDVTLPCQAAGPGCTFQNTIVAAPVAGSEKDRALAVLAGLRGASSDAWPFALVHVSPGPAASSLEEQPTVLLRGPVGMFHAVK